ncbi:MAG: PEP-CTERM sorting domain-containing protein [Verrucomicrobiota bacterium]|jgi:hypothetical protein
MNTIKLTSLLGAGVLACIGANAQVLDFTGLQDLEFIGNYYDGGFGSDGSGPGPNYGITFGPYAQAIISSTVGGTGDFQNAPSDTVAFFQAGPGAIMDKAAGFTTGFSFFYSAIKDPGSVTVWSGLDGTGTLLASLALPTTPSLPGFPTTFNDWIPVGVTFAGTAESVNFSGTADWIGFDDITLGGLPSPIPDRTGAGIYLLAGLGLAGAARVSRKQGITTV